MKRDEKPRHYKVILLTAPSVTYPQIKRAQEIINLALDALNGHQLGPGSRFADNVTAELEVIDDIEEARKKVKQKYTGLIISCGFEKDTIRPLAELCRRHRVDFAHADEIPPDERPTIEKQMETLGDDPHVMIAKFLTKEEAAKKFPGHCVDMATFTDSTDTSPEVIGDRVSQMIGLLALGVMQTDVGRSME